MTENEEFEFRLRAERERANPRMLAAEPKPLTPEQQFAKDQGRLGALAIGAGRTFDRLGAGAEQSALEATKPDSFAGRLARALPGIGVFADAAQRIVPPAAVDKRLSQLKATQQGAAEAYAPLKEQYPVMTGIGEAAPAMAVPLGGATAGLGGMMARGAIAGALPEAASYGTLEERAKNAAIGAAGGGFGGGVGYALGKAAAAAPRVIGSLAAPFSTRGQEKIIGGAFNTAAGGGNFAREAATNLRNAAELVPGSLPTAGQAAANPGIAALERTGVAIQPEVAAQMFARQEAQEMARRALLGELADPAKREFLKASRDTAAKELYGKAMEQIPEATPWLRGQMTMLMQRPAYQEAMKQGQKEALNQGFKINDKNATQVMHFAKEALDDQIAKAAASGGVPRGLMDTKSALLSTLESKNFAPAYREARDTFTQMSKPINEIDVAMDVANRAANKMTGKLEPAAFARALTDDAARKATGFRGATLENTLSPEYLAGLNAIKADLGRAQFAQTAGRGVGSDTVQKLAYSNMLDQAGIPTFLRNMPGLTTAGNLLARGSDAIYARQNREIANRLANATMSPQEVARMMEMAIASEPGRFARGLPRATGLLGSSGGLLATYADQ